MDQNQLEKVRERVLKETEFLPKKVNFHKTATTLYEKLGISYRVVEEYVLGICRDGLQTEIGNK